MFILPVVDSSLVVGLKLTYYATLKQKNEIYLENEIYLVLLECYMGNRVVCRWINGTLNGPQYYWDEMGELIKFGYFLDGYPGQWN